jgi:murein DD-endopeptidase MepM/ murein hydrolase activator NlpD
MKWKPKKFTFMVIPDANSSVMRFQLSAIVIVAGLAIFMVLLAAAIAAIWFHQDNSGEIGKLQHELSAAASKYEQTLKNKNQHIDELQTEVAGLSEQAKTIGSRMNDIKKLESQLKDMVGIKDGDSTPPKGKAAGAAAVSMDSGGTGGEELPVTEREMAMLVDQTREDLQTIGEQIEALQPELERTKQAVAKHQKLLRMTPTIWPADTRRVTSLFGIRTDPFTGRATFHGGLDLGGDTGDPVYATADGTVVTADHETAHGNHVVISHSNGIRTGYSHLSKILTEVGAKVSKGDIIGELGSTGRSTGPHLHYEVFVNGERVDPQPYLKASRRDS